MTCIKHDGKDYVSFGEAFLSCTLCFMTGLFIGALIVSAKP